jgi:hypothetical protein
MTSGQTHVVRPRPAPSRRRPWGVGTGLHDVPITPSDHRDINHDELSDFIRRFRAEACHQERCDQVAVLAAVAIEPDH